MVRVQTSPAHPGTLSISNLRMIQVCISFRIASMCWRGIAKRWKGGTKMIYLTYNCELGRFPSRRTTHLKFFWQNGLVHFHYRNPELIRKDCSLWAPVVPLVLTYAASVLGSSISITNKESRCCFNRDNFWRIGVKAYFKSHRSDTVLNEKVFTPRSLTSLSPCITKSFHSRFFFSGTPSPL